MEQNFERKHRNMICRRTRLWRKINHQRFNYFVTFTYADEKMTEQEFAKKLLNTLYHFSSRKGWLYIGAWERGGETYRLHFHGLFYIPEGTLSGEMKILRDFDTRKKRMQTVQQNTFFAKRFGRNEFRPINHISKMPQAVQYLVKYIEKSGGKLIYSPRSDSHAPESDIATCITVKIKARRAVAAFDFRLPALFVRACAWLRRPRALRAGDGAASAAPSALPPTCIKTVTYFYGHSI